MQASYFCVLWAVVVQSRYDFPVHLSLPPDPPSGACSPCLCSASLVDCSGRGLTAVPTGCLPFAATDLDLHNNSIANLTAGSFAGLSGLVRVDVSQNRLGPGSFSADTFRDLRGLLTTNLAYHHLGLADGGSATSVGVISTPPFVNLSSLRNMDLSHNEMDGLPLDFFRGLDSSLQYLDLSYNRIGKSDGTLPRFPSKLYLLDLSYNCVTGLRNDSFEGLTLLRSLNLSHNQIPYSFVAYPAAVFEPFATSLLSLRLDGNCDCNCFCQHRTYPGRALSVLRMLQSLHLDGSLHAKFGKRFRKLTSLVNLSLSGLEGSFCSMGRIGNTSFCNLPQSLQSLNISDCNITDIEPEAFQPLRNLRCLDVSQNIKLGLERFGRAVYGLQGSRLQELHMDAIMHPYASCVIMSSESTQFFRKTVIETISAKQNRIEAFEEHALTNMPSTLKSVNLDENLLSFGIYFKDLSKLESLIEINNDGLKHAPDPPTSYPPRNAQRCHQKIDRIELHLEPISNLSLESDENCRDRVCFNSTLNTEAETPNPGGLILNLPPSLLSYVSRYDKLYYSLARIEFNISNSLTHLDLSNNLLPSWIGPIVGLHQLQTLDLSNNFARNISLHFFKSLATLKVFNGSRNALGDVIGGDSAGELFGPLKNLQHIDLSKNGISKIPTNAFQGLSRLESLFLAHNELEVFEVNLSVMANLTLLDLAHNHIHYLPQSVMDHLDSIAKLRTVHVNMSFNSFACTCEHLLFLTWIKRSSVLFFPTTNLLCLRSNGDISPGTDVLDVIDDLQKTCAVSKVAILLGAGSCLFCLSVALVSALVYRFRWKLRYLFHASRLAYQRLDTTNSEFRYDAFVSYSTDDSQFVHHEMMQALEERAGLRLNLHHRDFTPGRPIPSNIVEAVQSSRRTLVVLSLELLRSKWCRYEMHMATAEAAHTGRDVLIFLIYGEVAWDQLPTEVLYNLKSSTYVEYPDDRTDRQLVQQFWNRLASAIKH